MAICSPTKNNFVSVESTDSASVKLSCLCYSTHCCRIETLKRHRTAEYPSLLNDDNSHLNEN